MSAAAEGSQTSTTIWNIDPVHSGVEFKVKHMMISNVKGHFSKVTGVLNFNEANPESSTVEATIDVASIGTRDAQRDTHLKSADFFDAEQFPSITFKSTKVKQTGAEAGKVEGELTIHGVTRRVVLDVEGPTAPGKDPWGNTRVGVTATTKISRKDFGLTWNAALETGGVLVGDEVTVNLDVQFVKAA
jgi:polyisoprenoid-binding protein YceI